MSNGCQECRRKETVMANRRGQIDALNGQLDDAYVQIGRLKAQLEQKERLLKNQKGELSKLQGTGDRRRYKNRREDSHQAMMRRLYAGEAISAEEVPAEIHAHKDFVLDRDAWTIRAAEPVGRVHLGRLLRKALAEHQEREEDSE